LPQNKEALLHRSGRTGRAGRKGVCALIVPVRARRRIERLLSSAAVEADWGKPPSVAEIDAVLDQRLLEHDALTGPMESINSDLLGTLLEKFTPEQLAAGIIRLTRHKDTAPEDLQVPKDERPRRERKERGEGRDRRPDREDREPRRKRGGKDADFTDGAWIKLGVGRKNNADPKWLVPMLCKAGGFSRDSIGIIQNSPGATHVELKPEAVEQLMKAAGPEQVIDKSIWVDRSAKPDGESENDGDRGGGRPRGRGSDRGNHRGRDRSAGRDRSRDHDGEGDRDRPTRARSKPRTGDKTGGKPAARKRADFASSPGKAKKLKKPRTGPKKPRGPNGEKKRSPKKSAPK
jgi:ATP-dependent RNA helicase DeaD